MKVLLWMKRSELSWNITAFYSLITYMLIVFSCVRSLCVRSVLEGPECRG